MDTPESLVAQIESLITLPEILLRLNECLNDGRSGAAEAAAIIEPDPALSVALLRIANSALYGVGGTVGTVREAVLRVGMREVWDLSLAISTSDTFDKIRNDLVTVEDFWLHSLYCATIAQAIDLRLPKRTGCPLFPAGLLHDIGHLIMFHLAPEKSSQALELSLDDGDGLTKFEAEQTVFGYDHADVGAALAESWNLPNYLRYPIEYHHKPFESPEFVDVVTTVHIANCLAILAEVESDDLEDAPPIADGAISRIGLEKNALPQILTESRSTAQSLLRLFTD